MEYVKPIRQMSDERWKFFAYTGFMSSPIHVSLLLTSWNDASLYLVIVNIADITIRKLVMCYRAKDLSSLSCVECLCHILFGNHFSHCTLRHTISLFLPEASFGLRVLSSPASVGLCVRVCVYQSRACPHDNSSPIQARITKFGPEMQNTLV